MSDATVQPETIENAGETPVIRLFKPGAFTSAEGRPVSFAATDLSAIAAAYDALRDPAPLVIGHPKMDDPAWGWVDSLAVEGDVLVARPGRVESSFAEMVRAGRFAKVSAQFYPPDHPGNPQPGGYYLKHVGFLGAHAPAVKGLGTVSLAEGEAPLVTIDFQPEQETHMPDPDPAAASFAEREAALNAREKQLSDRETALQQAAAASRHAEHLSFAEAMVTSAKLAPAGRDLLVGVLDQLGESAELISFGEADKMTGAAALRKLLEGAKPLVSFAEIAGGAGGDGTEADPTELGLEARSFAEAEAKAGRPISAADAVRAVQKKKGA